MGSEDEGLPAWMTKRADDRWAIRGQSRSAVQAGLDSLNVSVAGGILCQRLTRPPASIEVAREENENALHGGKQKVLSGAEPSQPLW